MPETKTKTLKATCQVCGKELPLNELVPVDLIRDSLIPTLKKQCPHLDPNGYVSIEALDAARIKHAEEMASQEIDELTNLRKEVAESLIRENVLTKNVDQEFDKQATRGEKLADKVASFGGSWTFIILFGILLFIWMAINTTLILAKPFDPYPYIFLNLVLSCLAAIQAPVIMMSQNRQEAKDRLRGENDYKVNLKAELEIQHINEKIDKLLNDQWKHLLEIQEMQMEMIQEMAKRHS